MRRPPKPFVTEYKASTRRHPSSPGQPQTFADDGEALPKPLDLGRSEPHSRSDDSYEAALRAADALFSGPAPATDSDTLQPTDGGARSDRPGGRILRVIDETPPEPRFEADEDPAPKRRGRKPGSKNKPKMPVISIDPATIAVHDFGGSDGVARHPMPASDFISREDRRSALITSERATPGDVAATTTNRAAPAPRTSAPSAQPRFAWVRTQLPPGQDWKRRRLPKVCW